MLIDVLRAANRSILYHFREGRHRVKCPVCSNLTITLGEVNFGKSCNGILTIQDGLENSPVRYVMCTVCQFCFAPEFRKWTVRDFEERIYNGDYHLVDRDYAESRRRTNARVLEEMLGSVRSRITHLDYGGGDGLLSRLLASNGWQSTSYDEFADGRNSLANLATYDFVTAFEVFEHVPDPLQLMSALTKVTHSRSLIFFSTLLSDGRLAPGRNLDWWYLAPRNGHVSLFSGASLRMLLETQGFQLVSLNDGKHLAFRECPPWAIEAGIVTGS